MKYVAFCVVIDTKNETFDIDIDLKDVDKLLTSKRSSLETLIVPRTG